MNRKPEGESTITDPIVLAQGAYINDQHLVARQSLYNWQQPRYDIPGIVNAQITLPTGFVIDVGCGNGRYLRRLRTERPELTVVGVDISAGILAGIDAPIVIADAMQLPFSDNQADVVLALHMIYHLPDISMGIRELARTLNSDGVLIASTNARDDKLELDRLWSASAADVLGIQEGPSRISLSNRFPLDEAPKVLAEQFQEIDIIELPGTITLAEPDPIIAHLASYRTWAKEAGVPFDATLKRTRERCIQIIKQYGEFRITCRSGVLVCKGKRISSLES